MKVILLSIALLSVSLNLEASDVKYFGENAVVPDPGQKELIAASIEALVQDCSVATKIKEIKIQKIFRGLEVNYSSPISFNHPPAGNVASVNKVIVRLWDNAEKSYGMDIYAYTDSDIYLLGKYRRLGYPIINMILRPMPPNKSLNQTGANNAPSG